MTFEQLKTNAEKKGFKFELQTWIPDDYDDNGEIITKEVSRWKVTYPPDWPHPPQYIDDVKGLQRVLGEYANKDKIMKENIKISEQTRASIKEIDKMLNRDRAG